MNAKEIFETFETNCKFNYYTGEKLRNCKAFVYDGVITQKGENYTATLPVYVLRSYLTNVAFIRKSTGTLYVFDYYSATTAQHIAKFAKDYGAKDVYYLYKRSDHTGYYNFITHERKTYRETIENIRF